MNFYASVYLCLSAGWRRPIGCLKLQAIFHERATNYRAFLRKMTSKDEASYGSSPPCTRCIHIYICIYVSRCIHIYIYIRTNTIYMYTSIHIDMYTHTHRYACIDISVYIHLYTYQCINTESIYVYGKSFICLSMSFYVYISIYVYVHIPDMYVHVHKYDIYTHQYIYLYTYTHIHRYTYINIRVYLHL